MFSGTIKLKLCEAGGLKPTDLQRRPMTFMKPDEPSIDPYVTIDVDDMHLARSTTKPRSCDPVWGESFEHTVEGANKLYFTVFHSAAIPPDKFVANVAVPFEDLLRRKDDTSEFWVS